MISTRKLLLLAGLTYGKVMNLLRFHFLQLVLIKHFSLPPITVLISFFIDSAPSSESATIAAARAADFVIVPCRASIFDVKAITSTLDLGAAVKANIGIVLNAVKSKSLDIEARKAVAQFDYPVAPVTLWDRVDYVRSLLDGQGVTEYDEGGKAANEIRLLYRWVNQSLAA